MATVKSQVTLTEETAATLRAMDARGRLSEGIENMYRDFKRGRISAPSHPHTDLSEAFNTDEPRANHITPKLQATLDQWAAEGLTRDDPRNMGNNIAIARSNKKKDEEAARKAALPELQLRSHIRSALTQDLGERWMQAALEAAEMPMAQARAILADVLANESEAIAEERAAFRAERAAHDIKMKDAENLYKQRIAAGMDAQQALIQGTHELGLKTAAEQAASEPSYAEWLKANPIQTEDDEDVAPL